MVDPPAYVAPERRRADRRRRRLIGRDGQDRLGARGASRPVRHDAAVLIAAVAEDEGRRRVGRRRRSPDVHAVLLPLVREWRRAARRHQEGRGRAHRPELALGILGDDGRVRAGVDDLVDAADVPGEVVQVSLEVDVDVDGSGDARREIRDRPGDGVDSLDPVSAVVRVEVVAGVRGRELRCLRVIEVAARDGTRSPGVTAVEVEGIRDARRRRLRDAVALAGRPPVVRARGPVVDLLPGGLADVVDEDPTAERLDRERERVAKPQRPDLLPGARHADERVVGRNGTVGVDPQQLAQQIRQSLRVGWAGVLADRDVELPVEAEVQRAAVVIGRRRQIIQIQEREAAPRDRHVAVGRVAPDAIVGRRSRHGVVDVDILVGHEVGIERDAEEPSLSGGVDRQRKERSREQSAILDHPQVAALLAHEHPAVRSDRHRRRAGETGDKRLGESRRQRCRPAAPAPSVRTRAVAMVSRLIRGALLGRAERLCWPLPPVKPPAPRRRTPHRAERVPQIL